jgi:hypothetical protein
VIRILIKDSLWRFKGNAAFVLLTDNIALLMQGSALVLALQYARWLEQDEAVTYLGQTWEARTSLELLWVTTVGIALALALSAGLMYLSRTRALELRRRYELFCSKRAIDLFGTARRVAPVEGQKVADDRTIMRIARMDSLYAGRVLFNLVRGIVPSITLVVILGVLMYLRPWLTLVLLAVMALSAGFLYGVSRRGARAMRLREASSAEASKEYRRAINWLRGADFPRPSDPDWVATSVTANKQTTRFMSARITRLRVLEESRLISNLVTAVAFFAILGTFGTQIITSGEGFGVMIVYLVALRKGMTSFREVNNTLSGINRFYPHMWRYLMFVKASESLLGDEAPPRPSTMRLKLTRVGLPGTLSDWELDSTGRIGLFAPVSVSRYTLALLVDSLLGGERSPGARYVLGSSAFATPDYEPLARQTFRESVGLPPDWDKDRLMRELDGLGMHATDIDDVPALDDPCIDDRWRRIGANVRFTLAVLSARRPGVEWIFLDENGLLAMTHEQRSTLLDGLRDRTVVIVYHHSGSQPGAYGEQFVAVVDGQDLIGLGEVQWFIEQREAAEAALIAGPLGELTRLGSLLEDEEEDDDDEDDLM